MNWMKSSIWRQLSGTRGEVMKSVKLEGNSIYILAWNSPRMEKNIKQKQSRCIWAIYHEQRCHAPVCHANESNAGKIRH